MILLYLFVCSSPFILVVLCLGFFASFIFLLLCPRLAAGNWQCWCLVIELMLCCQKTLTMGNLNVQFSLLYSRRVDHWRWTQAHLNANLMSSIITMIILDFEQRKKRQEIHKGLMMGHRCQIVGCTATATAAKAIIFICFCLYRVSCYLDNFMFLRFVTIIVRVGENKQILGQKKG